LEHQGSLIEIVSVAKCDEYTDHVPFLSYIASNSMARDAQQLA